MYARHVVPFVSTQEFPVPDCVTCAALWAADLPKRYGCAVGGGSAIGMKSARAED